MEPEFIEKSLGTELRYQAGYVRFVRDGVGGGSESDPVYKEMALTPEAFQSAYGISLKDLGVEPEIYLSVIIEADDYSDFENLRAFQENLGNHFLLLDEETMLLCGKGAFFRAEIVPESWPMIPDPNV